MSLLDELKKEAEQVKASGELRLTPEEQSQQFYEDQLKPSLLRIHSYFGELIEQLEIIKPEINTQICLPGVESLSVRQAKVGVNIDSTNKPGRVLVQFEYVTDTARFRVKTRDESSAIQELLITHKIHSFEEQAVRGNDGKVVTIIFTVPNFKLMGYLDFRADTKNRGIRVSLSSFIKNESRQALFAPEEITDEWLNHLGHFATGKDTSPFKIPQTELTEQQLENIREMVETEKAALKEEPEPENENGGDKTFRSALNRLKESIAKS